MRKPFIRINTLILRVDDIIAVDLDYVQQELEETDAGHRTMHFVRLVTREINPIDVGISVNQAYQYQHGTREAAALMAWLEGQTEDLLAEPVVEPMLPETP